MYYIRNWPPLIDDFSLEDIHEKKSKLEEKHKNDIDTTEHHFFPDCGKKDVVYQPVKYRKPRKNSVDKILALHYLRSLKLKNGA